MKKYNKWLSVLLILALALSLFGGMTVWAEEEPENVGDPSDELTALSEGTDGGQGDGSAGTPDPKTNTTPNSSDTPASTYVGEVNLVDYTVNPTHVEPGQYFSMWLTVADTRTSLPGVKPCAIVNSTAFTYRRVEAESIQDNKIKFFFNDILYLGGTPTMTIEISYPDSDVPIKNFDFTIPQCVDVPDPTPTPEPVATPEPTYKTPGIIIKQSSFGDAPQVQAGAEFTLTLTVFTTTGTENLTDVLVELSLPKDVSLATGNLNTYLGEIGPEGTRTVSYRILPSATFVDGVANIGVSMSGIGQHTGNSTSGSTSISVPVVQPERFEITNIEAPEMMMLGEEGYVSITFVNKGKTPINNLSAEIMGDNLANPGQSQFLGNIAAGTENSVDFNVMANEAGVINATVVLSYEDDAGNVKTLEKTFSCTVEEMPVFDDPGFYDPGFDMGGFEEPKAGMPWWGWVLILLAVGGGIAAVVIVLKKRKAKKALAELEDQDEDI